MADEFKWNVHKVFRNLLSFLIVTKAMERDWGRLVMLVVWEWLVMLVVWEWLVMLVVWEWLVMLVVVGKW